MQESKELDQKARSLFQITTGNTPVFAGLELISFFNWRAIRAYLPLYKLREGHERNRV